MKINTSKYRENTFIVFDSILKCNVGKYITVSDNAEIKTIKAFEIIAYGNNTGNFLLKGATTLFTASNLYLFGNVLKHVIYNENGTNFVNGVPQANSTSKNFSIDGDLQIGNTDCGLVLVRGYTQLITDNQAKIQYNEPNYVQKSLVQYTIEIFNAEKFYNKFII